MKNHRINPFTPSFGSIPPFMAGRYRLIEEILKGLENGPGDPNRATIFIGARGCGKTALLIKISEAVSERGWIHANVTAVDGMLEDIIERTRESAAEFIEQKSGSRLTGINIAGLGLTRKIDDTPAGNWRTRMNALLDALEEKGIGLLITVDEVTIEFAEMRILAATFQHFVSERRNVALFMAGLPQNVSNLLQDKTISFLRRAYQHHLEPIPIYDVEETMRRTFEYSGRTIASVPLKTAAEATGGYPFLIQLIGYHIWRQHPEADEISNDDVEAGVDFARAVMNQMILETTIREISKTDLLFLRAMTEDNDVSTLTDIAERMGVTTNYANQYRKRLLEHGIVGVRGRGKLGFEIPMLRDYLREN
jgi:hypothetical protein